MLRRLSKLGANTDDMLNVYNKQIRCILELAVPVWTPGLTKQEIYQIERVQKCALHVILGEDYLSYDLAVQALDIEKLSDRRTKLCLNFAKKCENHPKYSKWFQKAEILAPPQMPTRSDKNAVQLKYTPVPTRTDRYLTSPLPYLTNLLNTYHTEQK